MIFIGCSKTNGEIKQIIQKDSKTRPATQFPI